MLFLTAILCFFVGYLLSHLYYKYKSVKKDFEKESLSEKVQELISEKESFQEEQKLLKEKEYSLMQKINYLEVENESLRKDKEAAQIEMENNMHKMLKMSSKTFVEESEKAISHLLKPVQKDFSNLSSKVEKFYIDEMKEKSSLKEQIKQMVDVANGLKIEQGKMSNALEGNFKFQGDLGEIILQRLLEISGLEEGRDFIVQGKGFALKDDDDSHVKPDVIVNLPDKKHIVIDSKISLKSYYEYNDDKSAKKDKEFFVKQIRDSITRHINELSSKSYHHNDKLNSPNFTLLFSPIEGAIQLATQYDETLFEKAWKHSIILVSPSTLFPILKTISHLWVLNKQNKNVKEIAMQAGGLYDKFVGFLENMQDVEKGIENAKIGYDKAWNKLKEGKGNLIGRIEKIKKLGAKTKKQIPEDFLESPDENSKLEPPKIINEISEVKEDKAKKH